MITHQNSHSLARLLLPGPHLLGLLLREEAPRWGAQAVHRMPMPALMQIAVAVFVDCNGVKEVPPQLPLSNAVELVRIDVQRLLHLARERAGGEQVVAAAVVAVARKQLLLLVVHPVFRKAAVHALRMHAVRIVVRALEVVPHRILPVVVHVVVPATEVLVVLRILLPCSLLLLVLHKWIVFPLKYSVVHIVEVVVQLVSCVILVLTVWQTVLLAVVHFVQYLQVDPIPVLL